jgi:hypothetical protein
MLEELDQAVQNLNVSRQAGQAKPSRHPKT